MCELLGISANQEVDIQFSWREFQHRGDKNPHGWGIGFYRGKAAVVFKEPFPASESTIAPFLVSHPTAIQSKLFISHVRKGSEGEIKMANTHPFVRELFGTEWIFAHNGTVSWIKDDDGFRLTHYFPVGESDSEYAFCYLLGQLQDAGRERIEDISTKTAIIENTARLINERSRFNFLLSDGEYLYAFFSGYKSLYYVLRHPSHQRISLRDDELEVILSQIKRSDETAAIIATEPLTQDEDWERFQSDTLMVFKNGQVVDIYEEQNHERQVLRFIRQAPHRVSIRQIAEELQLELETAISTVEQLYQAQWIVQDSRNQVLSTNPEATFYTNPPKRHEIDNMV